MTTWLRLYGVSSLIIPILAFFPEVLLPSTPFSIRTSNQEVSIGSLEKSTFKTNFVGKRRRVLLHGSSDDSRGAQTWVLRNNFHFFLNQCALQSLMFLMNQVRDRQTALWLEEFAQPILEQRSMDKPQDYVIADMAKAATDAQNANSSSTAFLGSSLKPPTQEPRKEQKEIKLLMYHGLGIFNTSIFPTWDSFYEKLLQEPSEAYTITSDSPYVPDYELEVDPASLCSRIISVREQLASEFANDLDVIADMGGYTFKTYAEKLKQGKSNDDDGSDDGTSNENEEGAISGNANLLFLQLNPDEDSDIRPSPLRQGNFDLLVLLTTQESIHRLLNDPSKWGDASSAASNNIFLRNFYTSRVETHFTGSQWYGRADDFLQELLSTSPTNVQIQDEDTAMVDPVRIAQVLLQEREQVALDWSDLASEVPQYHVDIKRWQLNRLMGVEDVMASPDDKCFE